MHSIADAACTVAIYLGYVQVTRCVPVLDRTTWFSCNKDSLKVCIVVQKKCVLAYPLCESVG